MMKQFKRSRVLVAGPWLSELGWELMIWQATVRYQRISKQYEKVYVITFKGRECLYEHCELYEHDEELINSSFGIGKVSPEINRKLVDECVNHFDIKEPFDLFTTNKYLSLPYKIMRRVRKDIIHRKFYIEPIDGRRFDIAFHFRNFERVEDTSPKSFSRGKADRLVEMCMARHLTVCCIGAPGYSYVAKGAENRQSDDLSTTVSYICASRLLVGGSSAPMHLASLCGIPIVVWIGTPPGAERFFTFANPFSAKVFLVTEKTFNPEVEDIYRTVKAAIAQI